MTTAVRVEPAWTPEGADPERIAEDLRRRGVALEPDEVVLLPTLLGRTPTWPEAVLFGILWSEHCSYKSTRHLLATLPTRAPQVVLGPGEDAGVVALPEPCADRVLVLAHESHNHPSQVLPVEGAATGVGGIVRDVVCMGAEVIGVLDALRFGEPRSGVHVRDVVRGVVQGVADYGNPLGVPNLGGDIQFDARFDRNCLVNVMAVGVAPADGVVRSRVPEGEGAWAFVLVGKPTDDSGFGGAAFASDALGAGDDRGAVQIPDPFLARVINVASAEAFRRVRARGIPAGFKDLGAGGVACATSELAAAGGYGARIQLETVPRIERRIAPEVLLCSETQERFCWAVPTSFADELCDLYNREFALGAIYPGAAARVIGVATRDGRYGVSWHGETLVDCPVEAITSGRKVVRPAHRRAPAAVAAPFPSAGCAQRLREAVPALLRGLELCSREYLYRTYDPEVQGRAWLRPGEAAACVALIDRDRSLGVALGTGGNVHWCAADAALGARHAVAEAARKVAAVGARPWALTDCLNFGDARDPEVMGDLEATIEGLGAAARALGGADAPLPFVSGNVSLYNHVGAESIPPLPIVLCAGVIADVASALPAALTRPDDVLVRVGARSDTLTGSAYLRHVRPGETSAPPPLDLDDEARLQAFAVRVATERQARAAHVVQEGGTLIAVLEMLRSGPSEAGLGVALARPPAGAGGLGPQGDEVEAWWLGERPAILYAVGPERAAALVAAAQANGLEACTLGRVNATGRVMLDTSDEVIEWPAAMLHDAADETLRLLWNEQELPS